MPIDSGVVEVEYIDYHDTWYVDSGHPNWIHTAEDTRAEAIATARRLKNDDQTIKVKGPQMSSFKRA